LDSYKTYSDEQLIELLKQSDESAFNVIYDKFYASTCYYASYFLINKEDVKDVVTECFIKLWTKRMDFYSIADVKGFLKVSVRNSCFNSLKHQKVATRHQAELLKTFEEGSELVNPDLDAHLLEAEVIRLIYMEIEHLNPQCKNIFKLAYLENLKSNEIAEKLNISMQTVYNQKNIALKTLRLALQNKRVSLSTLILIYNIFNLHR
jgi:RNA polymerase sigma-70 factor, ECF subfamily